MFLIYILEVFLNCFGNLIKKNWRMIFIKNKINQYQMYPNLSQLKHQFHTCRGQGFLLLKKDASI